MRKNKKSEDFDIEMINDYRTNSEIASLLLVIAGAIERILRIIK